jgi:hypothetical protein
VTIGVSTPAMRQTSLVHPATAEMTVPAAMSPRFVRTPATRPPRTSMPVTSVP